MLSWRRDLMLLITYSAECLHTQDTQLTGLMSSLSQSYQRVTVISLSRHDCLICKMEGDIMRLMVTEKAGVRRERELKTYNYVLIFALVLLKCIKRNVEDAAKTKTTTRAE